MKIAISTSSFGKFSSYPLDICKKHHIEYTLNPYGRTLTTEEAKAFYANCIGIIAGTEPITKEVMLANKNLKVISRCGVGIDNIDMEFAKKIGIQVYCTPNAPSQATAEHTITLMLSLLRHTIPMHNAINQGLWEKHMGNLLHQKKVGIVGYGRIGKKLAKILTAFECEIAYHDPYIKDPDCKQLSLIDLLAWANIITLHCSAKNNALPILNTENIFKMQKGSWLINAARGNLIDEMALHKALECNHIAGAALDVFPEEPYNGILLKHKNIVLTPHAASYAKESRIEMETLAMQNLLQHIKRNQ